LAINGSLATTANKKTLLRLKTNVLSLSDILEYEIHHLQQDTEKSTYSNCKKLKELIASAQHYTSFKLIKLKVSAHLISVHRQKLVSLKAHIITHNALLTVTYISSSDLSGMLERAIIR
jgi:hypothetical protein